MLTKRITARLTEKEKPKKNVPKPKLFLFFRKHDGELRISKLVLIRPNPEAALSSPCTPYVIRVGGRCFGGIHGSDIFGLWPNKCEFHNSEFNIMFSEKK